MKNNGLLEALCLLIGIVLMMLVFGYLAVTFVAVLIVGSVVYGVFKLLRQKLNNHYRKARITKVK